MLSNFLPACFQRTPGDTEGRLRMSRTLTPDSTLEDSQEGSQALAQGAARRRRGGAPAAARGDAGRARRSGPARRAARARARAWPARLGGAPCRARRARAGATLAGRTRSRSCCARHGKATGSPPCAILTRWPQIRAANLYTAVATGHRAAFDHWLAADPAAATRKGGPLGWEPLLYLAYARLPGGDADAVDMVRALLDPGADPNARFDDGWGNPFTVAHGSDRRGRG